MRGPPPPSTEWNDAEGSRIIEDGRPPLSPAPGPAPAAAPVAALPVAPEVAVEDGGAFALPPPAPPLPPAPAAAAPAPDFPPAPCDRFSSTAFLIFCFRARSCPLSKGGQQAGREGRDDMEGKGQQAQGRRVRVAWEEGGRLICEEGSSMRSRGAQQGEEGCARGKGGMGAMWCGGSRR